MQIESTISIPGRCIACGSTTLRSLGGQHPEDLKILGEIHGKPFNTVRWRRCQCQMCGQVNMVKLYLYE